ncbi:MAG TPA: DoxX family protein [Longimicrobiales bacterium]|nr:DoxX family protein [Longimicrobiales bacterium]
MEQLTTSSSSPSRARWGMVPLRVVVGLVFIMHGGMKLFSFGIGGTTAFMHQLGIPLPAVAAVVVTAVELLGGVALILGLFTRWAGLLLTIDMLVAILKVRLHGGFFAPNGFEFEMTLMGAALTFALLGAGAVSLDALLANRRSVPGVKEI